MHRVFDFVGEVKLHKSEHIDAVVRREGDWEGEGIGGVIVHEGNRPQLCSIHGLIRYLNIKELFRVIAS